MGGKAMGQAFYGLHDHEPGALEALVRDLGIEAQEARHRLGGLPFGFEQRLVNPRRQRRFLEQDVLQPRSTGVDLM